MNKHSLVYLFCLTSLFMTNGCKKKSDPDPAPSASACGSQYARDVKPIVTARCAVSGCHAANFPFGDFTAYGDLKARIDNGKVNKFVFEQKIMPPASAPQLSQAELDKLKCWIDHGAPQD